MANEQGGKGNFANDPQRASEEGRKGGQQSHGGQSGQSPGGQHSQQGSKPGQQGGSAETNPGNFANDREKASEAGRKGGQS